MSDELKNLIDAVEAGSFLMDVLPPRQEIMAYEAFSGSLDPAKALHDSLLPGWGFEVCEFSASVSNRHVDDGLAGYKWFDAYLENLPARAWLLAILKAYKHQQETQ